MPPASETELVTWMREMFRDIPVLGLVGANPIAYDTAAKRVTIEYQARPEFRNLIGSIQGGMLTAMLDNSMSFAILGALGPGWVAPSLEIKTSYLAPAKPGRIVGTGTVIRQGRSVAFLEGRLTDSDGQLLTTATATAAIRPRPEAD